MSDNPAAGEPLSASPTDAGLSLEALNQAFAQMLSTGDDPYAPATESAPETAETAASVDEEPADDACEIAPRSILEAMLFVGVSGGGVLTSEQVAGLMRGVRAAEIDDLVRELNATYEAEGRPYTIVSEGAGYRMALREEFARLRDRLFGRDREARLSQAAVDVLALVAYKGPLTSEEVGRMRGTPSGAILSQLVRRQLLAVERPEKAPRKPRYRTTRRFLQLFGLRNLEELPRSQDVEQR